MNDDNQTPLSTGMAGLDDILRGGLARGFLYAAVASRARMEVQSLILLDRPVRKDMLVSAIQLAYNSRMKQLQVRDAAIKQFQSDEALRKSEHLAVAGRLVATMAHEVNNPLEALGNLLYLVENSATLGEARSFGALA